MLAKIKSSSWLSSPLINSVHSVSNSSIVRGLRAQIDLEYLLFAYFKGYFLNMLIYFIHSKPDDRNHYFIKPNSITVISVYILKF